MKMTNRWNRFIYRLWAPVYDASVGNFFLPGRIRAIELLDPQPGECLLVVGVGTDPNPLIPRTIQGLEVTKWGTIVVNEANMQTAVPEIFAGGDIVRGGATVILAMGDGKKAAESLHAYLQGKTPAQ